LNRGLRKLAASCLTYNILLELVWVPTWANPGDAPSRDAPLGDWRKKAVPFWEAIRDVFRDGHLLDDSSALSALMASAPVSEPAPAEESAAFGAELPLVYKVLLDQPRVERKAQRDESFEPPCRGPRRLRHIDQCLSSSIIIEHRDLKPCHAKVVSGLDYYTGRSPPAEMSGGSVGSLPLADPRPPFRPPPGLPPPLSVGRNVGGVPYLRFHSRQFPSPFKHASFYLNPTTV
jgi:hypothetical protein